MKVSEAAGKMILAICVLTLVIIAVGAVYYRSLDALPFALGTLLGSALNILKLIMLDRTVEKAVDMEEKNAGNFIRFQYLLRFLLTGLVLVLAVKVPFISLWGVIAGILTLQIAVFFANFSGRNEKKSETDENA